MYVILDSVWDYMLRRMSAMIADAFPIPVCKIDPMGKASYTNTPESLAQLEKCILKCIQIREGDAPVEAGIASRHMLLGQR